MNELHDELFDYDFKFAFNNFEEQEEDVYVEPISDYQDSKNEVISELQKEEFI